MERYQEWLALAQILADPFPQLTLPCARRNVTAEKDRSEAAILDELVSELGEATAQHLLQNNALDMCLHQVADGLLTRKLAEHGVRVTLSDAYAMVQQDPRLPGASL